VITLRALTLDDLPLIERWLGEDHVGRWWLEGSSIAEELADCRSSILGEEPTVVLLVLHDRLPIGWCQWYRCADYPDFAADIAAEPDEIGIDYAIGDPAYVGKGIGTELIRRVVGAVRAVRPGVGVVADPNALNVPSRRALEKNGFALVDVRPMQSEPTDAPMAIYRLPAP